ncbi:MAG: uncharacterized protein A8A55_3090 [Amphiamblys sp. WSBS2006]|nr:MAG: uncharacterized protein A8A55_3090 [Amphiamblys sp. WSBS2006]
MSEAGARDTDTSGGALSERGLLQARRKTAQMCSQRCKKSADSETREITGDKTRNNSECRNRREANRRQECWRGEMTRGAGKTRRTGKTRGKQTENKKHWVGYSTQRKRWGP